MTDADALLASILAYPEDDLPRLVFADWLDENGEHERAEFIRIGCELLVTPEYVQEYVTAAYDTFFGELAIEPRNCNVRNRQYDLLRRRERELLRENSGRWFSIGKYAACSVWDHSPTVRWRVPSSERDVMTADHSRGFIEAVRLPLAEFLGGECSRCRGLAGNWNEESGDFAATCVACKGTGRTDGIAKRLFTSQPITRVEFTDREPGQYANTREWYWVRWTEDVTYPMHTLPAEIFDRMAGESHTDQLGTVSKHYATEGHAIDALSDCLVRLGRSLANLRPLEPVV